MPDDSEASPCPFCSGPPDGILDSTDRSLALADAYPVTEGHALVVPRRHVASVFDLDDDERHDLWRLVARVRGSLMERDGVEGCTVGINDGPVAGQTVDHAHVHVIPRRRGDMPDPRGGVRWVIPHRAVYWHD